MGSKPTLYTILDDAAIVVCTDYHIAKALARALVFVANRPVTIQCGYQELKIVSDHDAAVVVPLSGLRPSGGRADS